MSHEKAKANIWEMIKYGIVGISNSLVCFGTILILHNWLNVHIYVSNFMGFLAGLINSFVWNKKFVFKTRNNGTLREACLFFFGWGLCYGFQLVCVSLMLKTDYFHTMSYFGAAAPKCGETVAQAIGMVIYTCVNFPYNKFVSFKVRKK